MMSEWVSVSYDMPLRNPGYKQCSVNVKALLQDGSEIIAYYAEDNAVWYNYDTCLLYTSDAADD